MGGARLERAPSCLGGFSRRSVGIHSAMSLEPDEARASGGPLAAEISTTFVRLHKEHGGRGPTKCRTYVNDDLIIVLMRGGYSRFEDTLFEDGKWLDVRSTRHAFQDTMEGRFTEAIERVTGRKWPRL